MKTPPALVENGVAAEDSALSPGRQGAGFFGGARLASLAGRRLALLALLVMAPFTAGLAGTANGLDPFGQAALMRALDATDRGEWSVAREALVELRSPLLFTYVDWRELAESSEPIPFGRYRAFIEGHADWPRLGTIRAQAERRLDAGIDYAGRRAFFADQPPRTREGRIRLAEAELAIGSPERGGELVRRAWVEDGFSASEEAFFLQQFGHLLTRNDHAARLRRLLWDKREDEARRMFRRVDAGLVSLAEARLALQDMEPGVDRRLAAVPRQLVRDPGLLYDRLRWRRLKGRDADAREILLDPPDELERPEAWWDERAYQIREALADRDFAGAYRLAKRHGQSPAEAAAFAEAEWLLGWLALRHANEPAQALGRFAQMYDAVRTPISRARAAYWAGRAAAALGDRRATSRWYRLAAEHPTTYYGQLALGELGEPLALAVLAARFATTPVVDPQFDNLPQVQLVRLFCALEIADRAMPFLQRLVLDQADKSRVMQLAADCGRPDLVVELGKHGVAAGMVDPLVSFPIPAHNGLLYPEDGSVEPALLLAIARQESHFDPKATSSAGAVGLMQVMPGTGKAVAERNAMPWSQRLLQRDPHYNAQIGARYLAMLAERYDGRIELMAAAYNAGPMRVSAWLAANGDPRAADGDAMVDWIELIPFRETRNYVQRVVEGRNVYRDLLTSAAVRPVSFIVDRGPLLPPPVPAAKPRDF
ncbi:MAG: lytic transglycosylase domain-containing protein [Geminicoccaceae bacterium]|jgi:soluble lytic murein transglycosylase|nr:lytic transglycosylase domain-containing protein [Geminicoccaceae bacterium]